MMYRLVIIDDEENIADGMANLFPWEHIGFEVSATFSSARKALSYIEKNPVHVVLTDISMPDMDGLALAKELGRFPDTYVVLFSSFQDYEYFRSAVQLQVFDYLLKPVRYDELTGCFEKLKDRLDQAYAGQQALPRNYYDSILDVVNQYMETHIQDASLEKAAEAVSLSASYLSKIYKEKSGTGFQDTLNRKRMEYAAQLLQDPSYKTYEIAYYVGYDNPKNFSRAFRTYYQVSPTEYRNGRRKETGEV